MYEGGRSFHFPDGNASIARSLVRKLIPEVAPGSSMEDIVTANFDYSRLDRADSLTRIRLSSTVVEMHHQNGDLVADVDVTYIQDEEARTVTAKKVVWVGYHSMLPFVCPDEPVILHLQHTPLAPGLPAHEQFQAGRRALLETSFETFERNVRDQLGRGQFKGPIG